MIQALAFADPIGALDPDERRDLEAEVAHLSDASVEIAASASGEGNLRFMEERRLVDQSFIQLEPTAPLAQRKSRCSAPSRH